MLPRSFISVREVLARSTPGLPVTIRGWVKNLRAQKKNAFVDVGDGSCADPIQVYLPKSELPPNLSWGSSVTVTGKLSLTPKGFPEVVAEKVHVVGEFEPNSGFPFLHGQNPTPEYARQHLHFRPRTDFAAAAFRARSVASGAVRKYFTERDFVEVHVPTLTSNDCEGAGEVFRVEPECGATLAAMRKEGQPDEEAYFGSKTFLTVSGQLHLEAFAHGLGDVYSFGPTFRAENSKSRLHLSEFYMIEAEMAFVDDLKAVVDVVENLVKCVAEEVHTKCEKDLKRLKGDDRRPDWLNGEFKCITYEEAIDALATDPGEVPPAKGEALGKEHELALVCRMGGVPTFVVDWPKSLKAFYARECPDDPSKVAALDLLMPITGEVAGGTLRENDLQKLEKKLPSDALQWYSDLRRFGGVPTGGFGVGFERLIQTLCGIPNIKDAIPFPRWPHNCSL